MLLSGKLSLVPILIIVPILTLMAGSCDSGKTAEGMDRLVAQELPVGSSVSQVMAFLDRQKIEHSELMKHPEHESDYIELKLDNKLAIQGYIVATNRKTGQTGLTTWNIQMYFYFDNKDTLIAHSINQIGKSP